MTVPDFKKLEAAAAKACKDTVYIKLPMGSSNSGFQSISLSFGDLTASMRETPRYNLANIPASIFKTESSSGKTISWHVPIATAKDDADLLMLLWNNARELIRLAKLGASMEEALQDQG